jgi:lactoylglutathione lyase
MFNSVATRRFVPFVAAVRATAQRQPAQFLSAAAAASSSERPFRVLGIQQVAIGGLDKKKLSNLWVDVLGLERVSTYRSEKENVDEDVLRAGRGVWAVEVDLMQPLNPDKSPKVHEPALNHIGLWIDDLPAAVAWLSAKGVKFTPGGIRKGASGFDVTFIHPKPKGSEAKAGEGGSAGAAAVVPLGGEGVLIELVQAPKEVIEAFNKLA